MSALFLAPMSMSYQVLCAIEDDSTTPRGKADDVHHQSCFKLGSFAFARFDRISHRAQARMYIGCSAVSIGNS